MRHFEIMDGRPCGEIVLGRRGKAERHLGRHRAVARGDELDPGAQSSLDLAAERGKAIRGDQIALVQDREIGAGELVGKHFFERIVVGERRVRRTGTRHRLGIVGEPAGSDGGGIDHRQHPVDGCAGADLGPGKGLHQRLRQSQARSLDQDVFGRRRAVEKPGQGRQKIIGDGAA